MRLLLLLSVTAVALFAQQSPTVHPEKPLPTNRARQQQSAEAQKQKQQSATEAPTVKDVSNPTPATPHSADQSADRKKESNDRVYRVDVISQPRDPWYVSYVLITASAVLIGIATLLVVIRQTKATEQAARGAQRSADAAFKNAQAVINAERPWIIPKMKKETRRICIENRGGIPIWDEKTHYEFSIANEGRTPAHVISVWVKSIFTDNGNEPPTPPKYDDSESFQQQRILRPQSDDWTLENWAMHVQFELIGKGMLDEVTKGNKWWWRYGRVRYRNVLDEEAAEHETRFCYLYMAHSDEFIISGPPEYTNYK
jgi:hypothetical protein